ncbi:DUF2271 domain-containing protein [Hyphomicrobium sp.]|uniref:DUF2271 domain-containing protein n=1 Tax=Hyphomicrobium sp. TaxID=82 RepID=UPI002D777F9E|nr:DUF2271 domain-containing protein [Hyphomicrobium sp.]HET6388556.1 DUF2271 domain-containing protein [Hyphomicrobium sp.]
MRIWVTLGATGLLAGPALGADLQVQVEIPKLDVAEYHRPYVAVWIERPDHSVAANLAVWYEINNNKNEGEKWLADLRQWWRRAGRDLTVPIDGVTGATRPVGTHTLEFASDNALLKDLAPGQYELVVEAAREVGGREVLRIPFQWPLDQSTKLEAKGESELGAVSVAIKD